MNRDDGGLHEFIYQHRFSAISDPLIAIVADDCMASHVSGRWRRSSGRPGRRFDCGVEWPQDDVLSVEEKQP